MDTVDREPLVLPHCTHRRDSARRHHGQHTPLAQIVHSTMARRGQVFGSGR